MSEKSCEIGAPLDAPFGARVPPPPAGCGLYVDALRPRPWPPPWPTPQRSVARYHHGSWEHTPTCAGPKAMRCRFLSDLTRFLLSFKSILALFSQVLMAPSWANGVQLAVFKASLPSGSASPLRWAPPDAPQELFFACLTVCERLGDCCDVRAPLIFAK